MPFTSTVHIDTALTTLSLAYHNEMYIGDRILPPVPIDKRSGQWYIYGREYFKKRDDLRRPGSRAIEWNRTVSTSSYNAEEHAQKTLVTDAEKKVQDNPLNAEIDATEQLTESVHNQREFRQIGVVTDPTQVTQNVTLSGTSQWSDYTNSVPLTNIRTAKTTVRGGIAREANMITLSYDAAQVLADHPSIKDLIKYTDPNNVSSSGLPNVLRGLIVNVAGALVDTANDGQAAVLSTAFGKNALVHYTTPSVGLKIVTFGYTLEAPDDTTGARGFSVRKWRDEDLKGDYVEVDVTYDIQLFAPLGGYLFNTCIA